MEVTKEALMKGIEQAQVGNRVGDIGYAIQSFAEEKGYGVVRDFIAHGIGPTIHEEPFFPHFGLPGKGIRLKEGMTITIEPNHHDRHLAHEDGPKRLDSTHH